jgi:hypothetical protein
MPQQQGFKASRERRLFAQSGVLSEELKLPRAMGRVELCEE